jgi:hypothetical protein
MTRYIPVATLVLLAGLAACGGSTDPVLIPVPDEPRESMLVDVTTGEIFDPSAFDIITGDAVRTDQFSGWDLVFQIAEDGSTLLWPRGAIVEDEEDSGLRKLAVTFDQLREAPESGYVLLDSVHVAVGDVFAARSRRDPAFGSVRCRRFAKIEVLGIDRDEGTVSLLHLVNPNCEKRTLVPGAEE